MKEGWPNAGHSLLWASSSTGLGAYVHEEDWYGTYNFPIPCCTTNVNWELENGLYSQSFGDNISERHVPNKRRRIRIQGHMTQLSIGSASDISEGETNEEGNGNTGDVGSELVKHAYKDETWIQNSFTYDPKPQQIIGKMDTAQFFEHIPIILQLFELFWPFNLLRKIVNETNRYHVESLCLRKTRGSWLQLEMVQFGKQLLSPNSRTVHTTNYLLRFQPCPHSGPEAS